jgi:RNA-directed DNA polymerase
LFSAWREFAQGKRKRKDVMLFEFNLEDNLFNLHAELKNETYQHSNYTAFFVQDPKLRHIHKAGVKDRVLHQAVYRVLCRIFEPVFIFDSYSSRLEKGTHRAVNQLDKFCRKLSQNNIKKIWVLKCDIKKFFDSVNHKILMKIISRRVKDPAALNLIQKIVDSFEKISNTGPSATNEARRAGIPLGNVTSQLFANIYLNEFDQFIKHKLKVKFYLRYCDDFVILNPDRKKLEAAASIIGGFLKEKLDLTLHPRKIFYRSYFQGVDFLGYVVLPYCRLLRRKTKKRMIRKLAEKKKELAVGVLDEQKFQQTLNSYLGVLRHCDGSKIKKEIGVCLGIVNIAD